jgi:4-hydroxy-2-oxoheptanedioate aldolase
MRKSKTLARIRAGEVIRGCVLGHYIPGYICHAARAGYDCIWLDLEHRAQSIREIQALLAFSHLYDIDIMLIPHVSTIEKARMLVDAVKFPPLGDRGIDNAGLDADFNLHDADEYVAWANRETFLTVQIETPEGVRNADAIAAVEGVDMIFVGPGDLGLRLRQSGEMTLDEAWERVAAACRKHGKAFGGPMRDLAEMKQRREQGAQLLINCSEFQSWTGALRSKSGQFEELL